jgi:hypothetical protein
MGARPKPVRTGRFLCPRIDGSSVGWREAGSGIRHQQVHSFGLGQHDNCPVAGHRT